MQREEKKGMYIKGATVMDVPGNRRGNPKRRWMNSIRHDLTDNGLLGEEAQYRAAWRQLGPKHRPHIKRSTVCIFFIFIL